MSDILSVVLSLVWSALSVEAWVRTEFRLALPSVERIAELAELIDFQFCSGLLEVLQASSPPSLQWFLSLSSTVPINAWGIYALILQKPKHKAKIYMGSSTAAKRGLIARLYEHDAGKLTPTYVKKALGDGYTITHKVLLVTSPIPDPSKIPACRMLYVAVEAVFACVFWAMAKNDRDYAFNHLCPWPLDSFTYGGTCSHNPLRELVHRDLSLSEEQLKQISDDVHSKNIVYGKVYHKRQRDEAKPEFRAAQAKWNKKHRPKTQQKRKEAQLAKKFYCATCDYAAGDNGRLTIHLKSAKHQKNVLAAQQASDDGA